MNEHGLEGSQTLLNLAKAYVDKVQTRRRYLFYSDFAARKELPVIEALFQEVAADEHGHGDIFYEYLIEGMNGAAPDANVNVYVSLGSIADNLTASAQFEYLNWTEVYPVYGDTAQAEGFDTIANTFYAMISTDRRHDLMFRDYLERFNTSSLYFSDYEAIWKCLYCGYQHSDTAAPDACPICLRTKKYFKLM